MLFIDKREFSMHNIILKKVGGFGKNKKLNLYL